MTAFPSPIIFGGSHGQYWTTGPTVHGGTGQSTIASYATNASASPLHALASYFARRETAIAQATATIKRTGVEAGEIIGWRAWRLDEGVLRSTIMNHYWRPRETLEAPRVDLLRGVHAWKTEHEALVYGFGFAGFAMTIVVGRVALWGEIIEFEKGWHGQHATPVSLDYLLGGLIPWRQLRLRRLRHRYGFAARE